jgi:hypothetical protein
MENLINEMTVHPSLGINDLMMDDCLKRYNSLIEWIDKKTNKKYNLQSSFQSLNKESKIFLVRSCPFRAYTESIVSNLLKNENLNGLNKKYLTILGSIVGAEPNSKKEFEQIGFDFGFDLIDQFPFNLTIWKQYKNHSGSFNELKAIEELFSLYMADTVGQRHCVLRDIPAAYISSIENCLECLNTLSSEIVADIFINVRHFCLIDYADWRNLKDDDYREIGQSVSSHLIPQCFFFSLATLASEPHLLEAIYHESLHKKLSTLINTKLILNRNIDLNSVPKFHSHWNVDTKWNSNMWEIDRALYALHVYSHLYSFYSSIECSNDFSFLSKEWVLERKNIALLRASDILVWIESINQSHFALDRDGTNLVQTLREFLPAIDNE